MLSEAAEFVIQGITVERDVFQPADWAERLCNSLARTGVDGRKMYSPYVRPMVTDGMKSVVVRVALQNADPDAFGMISGILPRIALWCAPGAVAGTPKPAGRFRFLIRSAAIRAATSGSSSPISFVAALFDLRNGIGIILYAYEQLSVAAKLPSLQGFGIYTSCSHTVFAPLARLRERGWGRG